MAERNDELAAAIARDGRPKYRVAADANIHSNVLSGIVSGRTAPTARVRSDLARVLGLDEHELFGADDQ